MPRELKNAAFITAEIDREFHLIREVQEDGVGQVMVNPTPLQGADESGCNWTVLTLPDSRGHVNDLILAVNRVKVRLNLQA